MRTAVRSPVTLLLGVLATTACGDTQGLLGVADQPSLNRVGATEAPGAPTAVPIDAQFVDLNPCSGEDHTVMFKGTAWIHELPGGQVVGHAERTVTTSSGFEGRGTDTFVFNGQILKHTGNDLLRHESGDQIRARFTFVLDLSTSTIRVDKGEVTCVGK
jgi:hypothetical protein